MLIWKGYVKGVDLGGWLSQCDHTVDRYENFIKEEDIAEVSTWGIDHLRLPVDYDLVETYEGEYKESGFGYIDRAIKWCQKYNLNLILDLHKTFGYSFDAGEGEDGFFVNEKYQERFYLLWEQFAKRYGNIGESVAFELLNEVTSPSYCDTWNRVADTCIKRIRAIAPNVKILVGGYWNNSVSAVKDIKLSSYENIILNFHSYEPMVFTHQGAPWVDSMDVEFRTEFPSTKEAYLEYTKKFFADMYDEFKNLLGDTPYVTEEYFEKKYAEAIKTAEERNTPLYCGEYGVINRADPESSLRWYETINPVFVKHGIGRAAWSYKEMDFGLSDEHMKPVIEKIKKLL